MKDYITAKERLMNPWLRQKVTNFLWMMLSMVIVTIYIYELLREVSYVN